ncbi:hypothetical protein EWM64_g6145 [Hericium alpestre]|uniref:DUF6534 domain-containing protein n=1 Tax=Hericium alpestre TaxID=135208 RepID=A0A4Y9ZWK0_9AGAM|nr:hypothetical protein EWM64_g6145 [Hericium alpestre]
MPALIPVDNSLGALEIGGIVATAIWGITCMQVYMYYTEHCGRDGVMLKGYVALLMVIDTFHAGLIAAFLYHYTVTNFGDYSVLARDSWMFLVQIAIGLRNLTAASRQPYATGALALHITCDATITTAMVYYLLKNRGGTGVRRTRKMVTVLMAYALNTGLLTTTCNLACLIAWVSATDTLIFAPFFFVYVKLYSCSFMAILNSRDYIRGGFTGASEVITFSQLGSNSMRNTSFMNARADDELNKDPIDIHIASEVIHA